jgi:hypothetical protein
MTSNEQVVPRVVGPSRRALDSASALPIQRRAVLDEVFVPAVERALRSPHVIAIVADAGFGKSVLLGQLYDEFAARQEIAPVLVSSSALNGPFSDIAALDNALGEAVGVTSSSVTYLLRLQRTEGWQPILLLDTIDLLLDEHFVPLLARFLRRVVDEGVPAVVTCRQFEFDMYLEPIAERAPLLADLVTPEPLFGLKRDEVRAFVTAYLVERRNLIDVAIDSFVDNLLHLRERRNAIVEICRSPLLLSLVCTLYAPEGEVPEDLTVSLLYSTYWERQVRRDRTGGLRAAAMREQVCLRAAAWLRNASTARFVEEFPESIVGSETDAWEALEGVRSSGVIVRGSTWAQLRFFHQSFAEYAIARQILDDPATRDEFVQELALTGRDSHLWPVLVQLLYAAGRRENRSLTRSIVDRLDLSVLQALRAAALTAVAGDDLELLTVVTERSLSLPPQHQQLLAQTAATCSEALAAGVAELLERILGNSDPDTAFSVAQSLGVVMGRIPVDRTVALEKAAEVLFSKRNDIEGTRIRGDTLVLNFLKGLQDVQLSANDLTALLELYPRGGPLSRGQIVRLFATAPRRYRMQLAAVALHSAAPGVVRDELIVMLQDILATQDIADSFGWNDWRSMLATQLPDGWEDIQCGAIILDAIGPRRFVGVETLGEIVDLCQRGEPLLRQRALFIAQGWAPLQPQAFIETLCSQPPPASQSAAAAARAIIYTLPILADTDAQRLIDWITPALDAVPNVLVQIWAFAAKGHVSLLADALTNAAVRLSGKPRDRAVAAALDGCPVVEASRLQPELDHLCGLSGISPELVARIAGILAPVDSTWRARCRSFLLGVAASHARAAAGRLAESAAAHDWFDDVYLAGLLSSAVPGAVISIADLISVFQGRGRALTTLLADAVRAALEASTAAPLTAQLLALIETDIREGGILGPQLDDIITDLIERSRAVGERGIETNDQRISLSRGVLTLMRQMLLGQASRETKLALLLRVLRDMQLDNVRNVDDDIHRLAVLAEREMPGALAVLVEDLGSWSAPIQLGLARAVREVNGSGSSAFRQIARMSGVHLRAQQFVVRHLE